MTLSPEYAVSLLMWTLTIGLAGFFFVAKIADKAGRAFAATLVMLAVANIAFDLGQVLGSSTDASFALRLAPYFEIAAGFFLIRFATVYPRSLPGWQDRAVAFGLLAGGVVAVSAYGLDHELWGGGRGPLMGLHGLAVLVGGGLAFHLVKRALSLRAGPAREAQVLVAIAWMLFGSDHGTWDGLTAYRPPSEMGPFLSWVFGVCGVILAVATTLLVLRSTKRAPESLPRWARTLFPVTLVTSIFLGVIIALMRWLVSEDAGLRTGVFFDSFECAFFIGMTVYALLRYQMFDIDLKIKLGLQRGAIAGFFLAVFLIVSQLIQNVANQSLGYVAGAVVAGLSLFALRPLENAITRTADLALPGITNTKQYVTFRKLEVYRAAVESAAEEGGIGIKERALLERLGAKLGLSPEDVRTVEAEVESESAGPLDPRLALG